MRSRRASRPLCQQAAVLQRAALGDLLGGRSGVFYSE
jgi:hypothetical protein